MEQIVVALLSSDIAKNSPLVITLAVGGIATYFGAKGILSVLQEINGSLTTIHATLKVLVEQSIATNKILDNEIDRLLNMIDNQLRK